MYGNCRYNSATVQGIGRKTHAAVVRCFFCFLERAEPSYVGTKRRAFGFERSEPSMVIMSSQLQWRLFIPSYGGSAHPGTCIRERCGEAREGGRYPESGAENPIWPRGEVSENSRFQLLRPLVEPPYPNLRGKNINSRKPHPP